MPVFLGLDIGTTSTIGLLADDGDRILATAKRPVNLSAPSPGWAEEDPDQWWANVCAIVPELLETAGCQAGDIAAVGVTGISSMGRSMFEAGLLARVYGMAGFEIGVTIFFVSAVPSMMGAFLGSTLADRLRARDARWPLWVCAIGNLASTPFLLFFLLRFFFRAERACLRFLFAFSRFRCWLSTTNCPSM